MRRAILVAIVPGMAALAIWLTVETRRDRVVWDHWDVVKPGVLYRSGQLKPDQLAEAVKRYGLRTVVNFQVPSSRVKAERELARKLGVDFMNLPMPGDGFGQEAQFREVLKACDDPSRRPVLVHCARGTCRTGAAVALFRYERDGWTVDDVAAELERQTYRDGWLTGYLYAMVKSKPRQDLYQPAIALDHNRPPESDGAHPGKEETHVH